MAKHKQVVDANDAQAHPEGEGGAIMSNASTEAGSDEQDDSFELLLDQLESAIHRLKLAAVDLGDLDEEMPNTEKHGSAAFVVREVTRDLNLLYRDLDVWQWTHEYTQKDIQPLMEHLRQLAEESGDDTDVKGPGRTVLSPSCI